MEPPPEAFFNIDFFRSLVTTSLAILGAFFIWWLTGLKERQGAKTRRKHLAQALHERIEFSLNTVRKAINVPEGSFATTNVDLSLLDGIPSMKYEVLGLEISTEIDALGYHLSSFHRFLDIRLQAESSGSISAMSNRKQLRDDSNQDLQRSGSEALEIEEEKQILKNLQSLAT